MLRSDCEITVVTETIQHCMCRLLTRELGSYFLLLGSLLNFVKTGLNLNLDDFFMRLCLFLSPGFAFTQAIEVFSYNYWVQKKCADPVQVAKCAAQEIDPCCPGKVNFVSLE